MNRPPPLPRYGVSLLAVTAAMLLRRPLWDVLRGESPFLFPWPAVMFAAWYGDVGPGAGPARHVPVRDRRLFPARTPALARRRRPG